MGHSVVFAE